VGVGLTDGAGVGVGVGVAVGVGVGDPVGVGVVVGLAVNRTGSRLAPVARLTVAGDSLITVGRIR